MALKSYSTPKATKWVTVGGFTRDGKPNPTKVSGYYLGTVVRDNPFEPGKEKIEHTIKTTNDLFNVNGSAQLNNQIREAVETLTRDGKSPLGMYCEFTFLRTEPSKKGSPTKIFSVQFDEDLTIDPGSVPPPAEYDGTDSDDDTNYAAEAYTPARLDRQDAAQNSALSAMERSKTKPRDVAAMLNSRNKTK